jgi:hypothetical protein
MASDLITTFDKLDVNKISYGAPKVNARGGKAIKILDPKRNTLVLSTPLILTWGVNKIVDEETGRVGYNLALQFPSGDYGSASAKEFYNKMQQFESKILDDAVVNSKEWLSKPKMSREVAEALFTPMLKYPKNKETNEPDYDRAPTMRIKIPYWEGKFNVELYDTNQTQIFNPETDLTSTTFESFIPKGSHIAAAIQCNGVWYAAGKFGVTWQLVQAIVRRPARIQGSCFLSLSNDDQKVAEEATRREVEAMEKDDSEDVVEETHDETQVEDSDEEEEEEEKPVVKAAPAKRRVVKKKTT